MTASKQVAVLSVRLPASKLRRIKSLAASRGVTLQEAVNQALEAWAFHVKPAVLLPLDALEGSLAGVDVERIMREDRKAELAKDRTGRGWPT
ncbi:MAG: hypothetical protein ABSD98_04475 [Candidatus Korobacteraceae bacterium]|jgi:hypothetical protein